MHQTKSDEKKLVYAPSLPLISKLQKRQNTSQVEVDLMKKQVKSEVEEKVCQLLCFVFSYHLEDFGLFASATRL